MTAQMDWIKALVLNRIADASVPFVQNIVDSVSGRPKPATRGKGVIIMPPLAVPLRKEQTHGKHTPNGSSR